MPLRPEAQTGTSMVPSLWCMICQIVGNHATNNCHLLQDYTQTSQQLFYNFYKSVGHDERTCRSYELMMDQTPTYIVQAKTKALDQNIGMACIAFQGHGRGQGGLVPRRGCRLLICYNCGGPGHYSCYCTNPTRESCLYCTQFDHDTEEFPTLISRLHDKGTLHSPPT